MESEAFPDQITQTALNYGVFQRGTAIVKRCHNHIDYSAALQGADRGFNMRGGWMRHCGESSASKIQIHPHASCLAPLPAPCPTSTCRPPPCKSTSTLQANRKSNKHITTKA